MAYMQMLLCVQAMRDENTFLDVFFDVLFVMAEKF